MAIILNRYVLFLSRPFEVNDVKIIYIIFFTLVILNCTADLTNIFISFSVYIFLFNLIFFSFHTGNINVLAAVCGLVFILIAIVILISILSVSRHSAKYYTHEEKRDGKETIVKNSQQFILF